MLDKKIVILTGAGISAESGIPTYRDREGLWKKYDPEKVSTHRGFTDNVLLSTMFYKELYLSLNDKVPNPAHFALNELNSPNTHIFTQNIDGLHQLAGNQNVFELHGDMRRMKCHNPQCKHSFTIEGYYETLNTFMELPRCPVCNGQFRPNIVMFEENPYYLNEFSKKTNECDLFIAIGTSAVVHPAASFLYKAIGHGKKVVWVNTKPLETTSVNKEFIGNCSEQVPKMIEWLKSLGV